MQTYGNKIWNDATDNDNKTVVKLKEKDLASLCRLLDNAGLNYYAYSSNGYSRLAFNSKDLEWFKRIVGKDLAEQLDYQLPSKPYHPNTRMNIFGTIEFRYIPHKKYFSGDPDLLLKMAEILTEKGIHFSGRIYTEKTAKLTISDENIDELHKIKDEISEKRSLKSHAVLALDQEDSIEAVRLHDELSARRSTIISRQTQTKNQNKATSASVEPKQMQHFHSIILQKNHFSHIKPYLNLYLDYSYQSDARKVILQSSSSLDDIKSAVAFAARHYEIIEELRQCGFDKTQINAIEEVIRAAAQQDVEITQYLNTDYSVDELNELSKPLIAYINANIIDRMSNVGNVVNNLTDTIDLINDRLNERKFYENHEYNAAQKNAIAECVANGMSWDALQEIDESFSAEQIHTLADMFIKAIKGDIEPSSITDFVNDVKSGKYDETSMLRLKEISDEISNIKSDIAQKISGMNAAEISLFIKVQLDRLTVLEREQERLEKYLQDQPIGQSDIDRLRAIEPKRKSVQNLLDTEVAQVPKFEKQQADKMGERSAFEMRKSDNAWRNDESRTVPVISVAEYSIPDKIQLLRKDSNIERGTFVNADTGISITFGRNCLDEIVSKTIEDDKHKMPVKARVCSLYHVQEIIENAICFDSTISEYDANTSKNKSPNTLFMHRMYGAINYQDDLYLVSLAVEEMYHTDINNKFSGTKNRLYSLRDIKITPTEELGGQTHFSLSKDKSTSSLGANISIPQLYSLVKTYDKNFYENPSAVGRAERLNELEIDRTVQAAVVQYAEPENDVTLSPLDTKSETQEIEFTAISEMDLTKQLDSLTAAALDRHSDLMLMLKNNFDQKNVALRSFADNHIDKLVYDLPMPDNEAFMLYYFSDKHHDSIVDDIFQKAYKETERLLKIEKFAKENGIPYSDNGNVDAEAKADIYAYDGSMSIEDFRKMQLLNMLAEIIDSDDDTPYKLIEAFDGAAMPGWEKGDNMPKLNRIKKALYDILGDEDKTEKVFACIAKNKYNVSFESERKTNSLEFYFGEEKNSEWFTESDLLYDFVQKNPDCSFALGNAIVQYLDEKQHSERNVSELKAGWYKKTNFTISAIINNEGFNYSGRFDIGDGKDDGGGSLIDHIRTHNEGILKYTQYPFNQPEYKENAQKTLDIFVPFLEAHSELTAEEQRIFDDFKTNNPIRTREDVEKAQVKYQIYQLSADDKYHGIRFEGMEQLKKDGVQLNHDDYELVYEGEVGEFRGNATLEALFAQYNNDRPEDFRGHSLSVSDVIVISVDGKDTAYFCDSFGFTEMPEFFREKELVQEKPESAKVSDLAVGDTIMYEGKRREIEEISTDRIKMKDLDAPDYGGILLGTSDVLAYDGWQQDMEEKGFEIISKGGQQAEKAELEDRGPVSLRKVGDFYEMFGKDAEIGAEVLDLHMISKQGEPMVGFPDIKKDEFSEKLKRAGYSVVTDEQSALLNAAASAEEEAQISGSAKDDFTITDNSLGEGGAKAKFKANIEAIKCLKALESEHRPATSEEKEILSKYVGWGGISQAFDSENKSWSNEYKQLKELLTDDEFTAACESTLNSFYTSPIVIDSIYSALRQFGYNGGNLLEPSCGVGNFFGRMPEDLRSLSNLYGVEIDSLTGRIAKAIYNTANIQIKGFEKTDFQDGCFDVAVGNVPFGDLVFRDQEYKTSKLHDYFFAKTLDKVKDGGIIAYVTSKGTLDKKDESVRRYLAEHTDLIGAIRLPNNAFKANANTEVTTDIIFLQKRSSPPEREPEWVHLGKTEDGLTINSYYEQHPEMVLGQIVQGNKLYGHGQEDTMCVPIEGTDLQEQLSIAVSKLSAEISDEKANEVFKRAENDVTPPEDLRNYSLFQSGDKIYFKSSHGSAEMKFNSSNTLYNHARAFIALRDCTRELLSAQERNASDEDILALQKQLNTLYDDFYSKYGLINSRKNQKHFGEDISYHLLCSLEKRYDKDVLLEKSDIFTKRTVKPAQPVTHVDNTLDALALSVVEKARVDLDYIESLTGVPKDSIISSLKGEIYPVPYSDGEYQTASEYLSGDIYQKLLTARAAAEKDSKFMDNVKALEEVMPEPVKAGDIEVHIGATWIDPKYYELFMYETFDTPKNLRNDIPSHMSGKAKKISVEYIADINQYNVINKTLDSSVTATKAYGTDKINAYEIMNYILNMRDPKVTKIEKDSYGHEKRVIDIAATKIAQKKADKIRSAFADWIFKDPERREELVQTYNNTFNCIRPRQYNGSALSFPGMSVDVQLHEHQKDAIAHALFGGNTLFAHSVGAGKTYEMIAAAMESKRLGLCSKTLMVVPNHLTEQVGSDFLKLYPNANILVASKNDFKKENRQALFGKIATGNFDAIIIGHSQLKMIPMSKERQEQILNSQINDVILGIEYLKANGGSGMSIKQMIRTKMRLEKALNELKAKKQDDITTFEEMGIDKLIVDEAHEFKNLFTPTKLQNMSGISQTASQKAQDLFVKAQFLNEKTGGKGLILATGTPLSNSVTELHTMMRYLEYDFLKEKHLDYFDNFISVFGERKTDWELAPAGNKFKLRTRIANYNGMPELMSMFKQVADVRTADTLDLDVPKCETHIINVEPTEFQQTLVQELADRADAIQHDNIDPSVDNMLSITSDGRKLGLDPRLIDPSYDDEPQTKLNQCVDNVYKIYEDTAAERLTQIIFCDLGVPHGSSSSKSDNSSSEEKSVSEQNSLEEECDFCIYDDIKKKLVNKGVLPEEIAYIHDAKTEIQKAELFEKVRNGEVRVLLGSTAKMGTGTNVQDKLIAIHDLDIPWRPADLEQRKGRMVRQGNQNSTVHLYRYVTKGTFDAYSYQTLEAKQKFISQIMTSKSPVRKCEDIDQQSLTYAEIKTLCTGDERIKEKMQLDNDVKELRLLKAEYTNVKHEMEDKIRNAPYKESLLVSEISNLERDIKHIRSISEDDFSITIKGNTYIDRPEAAKALEQATFSAVANALNTNIPIGEFKGFPLSVSMRSDSKVIRATLSGSAPHIIEFGVSYSNNIKRMENSLYKLEEVLQNKKYELSSLRYDVAEAKKIIEQPFAQETELEEKSQRLETLSDELIKAAMESKSNQKTKSRTNYFSCAKLKREAAKLKAAQGKTPKKDKKIGLGGDALGTGTDDNSL